MVRSLKTSLFDEPAFVFREIDHNDGFDQLALLITCGDSNLTISLESRTLPKTVINISPN